MKIELTYIFCVLLCSAFSEVDWCDENCGSMPHVRCGYRVLDSNELCHKIKSGMEPSERKDILDIHNKWRDFVASGNPDYFTPVPNETRPETGPEHFTLGYAASDMRQLTWDYDLELNARIWVSQCDVNSYRPYHCVQTEHIKVVHMNKDDQPKELIIRGHLLANHTMRHFLHFIDYGDTFYNNNKTAIITDYTPGVYNTFFAMIFSKSTKLGCSKVVCYCEQDEWPLGTAGSVVCIYGPSFDHTLSGYEIYKHGPACSACPEGTSCKKGSAYPNLCATPDDPTEPVDIPNLGLPVHPLNVDFAMVVLVVTFF